MKRKLMLVLAALLPMLASAYDAEIDGIYYNLIPKANVAEVAGSSIRTGAIVIPETITYNNINYSVTSICNGAFDNRTNTSMDGSHGPYRGLTSIAIPKSVTSIGDEAFRLCINLTSITIGNGVKSIGKEAFSGCGGLTSFIIPENVISIGESAFSGCTGLFHVNIPNSVTSIGNYSFSNCESLTSVSIGNGVKKIGNMAFYVCNRLTKVIVPDIAAWCNISFSDDMANPLHVAHHLYSDETTEITDLVIPNSVTSISNYAFFSGWGLTSITIPNGVTSIGEHSFDGCFHMTSVNIPNSVVSIGKSAFDDCSGLTTITIPNSVTSIGESAFSRCSGLTSITIPSNVTSIEKGTFWGCGSLTSVTIPNAVTYIGYSAFARCTSLTSINIPNSVTEIAGISFYEGTFQNCSSLTSVSIGSGITRIGDHTFANCTQLTDVNCYAENVPNTKNDAFEDSYIGYTTLHVPAGSADLYKSTLPWSGFGTIVPLDGEIEEDNYIDGIYYSFTENDAEVTNGDIIYSGKVVIPSSVFYKGKTYPVTSIGENAFSGCTGLTSVTIPNSVTSIEKEAFNGCNNITSLNLDCENIEYWFHDCQKSLSTLIFGDNVKTIGGDTFQDCSYLTTVTWGKNVASIGKEAFKNCSRLSSIVIPESVTSIGNATFKGCSSLNSIRIPNSITSIGNNAFSDCNGLTSIKVEDGNNIYDSRDNCNAIIITGTNTLITGCQNTIIPNSVTAIGLEAFRGCSGLTSITIPASVTYVGDNAFKGCTSLKNVSMETNKPNKHFTRNNSDERWHDYVAISGTQGVNDSEDYTMLLDNDINTKWCVAHVDGTIYIEFDATCPIKPTEYMLTTGNDTQSNPGRNPKSWIIKGRNSTSDDWTTLTTVDDGNMPSESFVSKTFSLNTNTAYRYYRFEVTSLVSGTIFQLSEFCFLINDTSDNKRWLNYIATAGTPGFDTSENYPKLLDNDISTKWCTEYINGSIFIEFDATSSITPIGYELTTGNDTYWEPGRNPKSWIIKGRNETSDEWTTLTTVDDGNMPSESYASKTFSLNTNTSYRYYRFEVTSLVSGTIFQLSEFCFLVSDNNDEPIDHDTDVLVLGSNGSSPLFADCPLDSVFIGRNISYSTSSNKGYSPFYCNTPLRSVNISGAAKEVFSKEFYGCTNLKNVQIGGKMSTIGDYAFYGCTGLKEFYCEAEQTPAVTSSSFKNVDVSAVMLVVPDNSVELYKAHPIWKLFWVETPTGIKETNSLTSGLSKGEGDWYDLQGRKLAEPQKGINIIRYRDGTTRKVLVR